MLTRIHFKPSDQQVSVTTDTSAGHVLPATCRTLLR